MTAKHTPTPWHVYDDGGEIGNRGTLAILGDLSKCKEVVHWAGFDCSSYPVQARANANRIVTCVNACASLPDPERDVKEMVEALRQARVALLEASAFFIGGSREESQLRQESIVISRLLARIDGEG